MKKLLFIAACLLLALSSRGIQAAVFPVIGTGASGKAGDRVVVELVYDYGAGFGVVVEDLQMEYQFAGLTFVPAESTIDVFGGPQNLIDYADTLQQFAQLHLGDVLVNLDPPASRPDFKGYALSFYTADGTPQVRSGQVHLLAAFDIASTALPGTYEVSFTDLNLLVDDLGNEFTYPGTLQQLAVTVIGDVGPGIPEPNVALLLLPGLLSLGLFSRRCASRQL